MWQEGETAFGIDHKHHVVRGESGSPGYASVFASQDESLHHLMNDDGWVVEYYAPSIYDDVLRNDFQTEQEALRSVILFVAMHEVTVSGDVVEI